MPYQAQISRQQPALLILLLDQSASMTDPCAGSRQSKAAFLADAINSALRELVGRCTRMNDATGEDEIRRYFDICILGYGGNPGRVAPAFGGEFKGREMVNIEDLAYSPMDVETRKKKMDDGAGGIIEAEVKFPVWIRSTGDGYTPMCAALREARRIAQGWVAANGNSFPPIVLNLTDGEATDGVPVDEAAQLRALATADGNLLLYNCHISDKEGNPVSFPAGGGQVPANEFAQMLFEMSSAIPETTLRRAAQEGNELAGGARGFVFNGEAYELVRFLDIGTKPTNKEAR